MRISFTINGQRQEVDTDPKRTLLKVLRDDLRLTGTKQGCDGGECGSCTILLDGKAAMSCLIPMSRVEGREVVTIEGLAPPEAGQLHSLQEAFVQKGAVQCGYCTPGMIMEAKALLDANPNPTRDDIVKRLSRNLCRCTGYVKIVEAVLYAAHLLRGGEPETVKIGDHLVGARLPRVDGREKVTGQAIYGTDLYMEGMLHAKTLRSPHHHALILSIDTSEAEKLPGVTAVVTAKDIPGVNTLRQGARGTPVLAEGKVEYMGDPVAAVAAETEAIALEALSRIKVDYQPLDPVFDARDALKETAPSLRPEGNLDYTRNLIQGDVAQGFAQAHVVVENSYATPFQEHAYLEPDAALSYLDEGGNLVTKACTQFPSNTEPVMAIMLGIDQSRVKVIPTYIGGGFGGKYVEHCWMLTALLTHKTRRPVKMVFTREECLLTTKKRHATHIRLKTGATRDGRLVAVEGEMVGNSGAYPTGEPATNDFPLNVVHGTGPYHIPHVSIRGKAVGTNVPKSGAFRGLGNIQAAFAYESQMDQLAQKLGLDPLEFRLQNAYQLGSRTATGQVLEESVGVRATLEAIQPYWREAKKSAFGGAATSDGWVKRGAGIATAWRCYPIGYREAFTELQEDGRIVVETGATEMGQGTFTIFAQMAADELKVPLESLVVVAGSNAHSAGSTTTQGHGNAIMDAVRNLKAVLLQAAADMLEEKVDNVRLENGFFSSVADPSLKIGLERLAAVARGRGIPLRQKGSWHSRMERKFDFTTGQGVLGQV
ncbi:MAG: molybdopterin-dependent oxidoreductase, partial [Chloroflexi bacterium]|nr:molybdopterin-dependent oxidoreductase [Chloroflexota bacterium]